MKYIIYIALLFVGLILGYVIGVQSLSDVEELEVASNTEKVTEFIYDTIIERETIEVPVYLKEKELVQEEIDTGSFDNALDTLTQTIQPKDTSRLETDVVIKRERLVEVKEIRINYLSQETDVDTLIKEMLGINEVLPETMQVEFWESPLGFNGYKCAKSKLILYGLSPQFTYEIFKKDSFFYLQHEAICYRIKETQEFLEYKQVNPSILND